MFRNLIKLSVLFVLAFMTGTSNADSFLLSNEDHIIPLVYIEDMEYYNHKKTRAYTQKISDKLSLMPEIIVATDKSLTDYIIVPKLMQSQIEPINAENSRYNMSVVLELQTKNGDIVAKEQQNRYIVIENSKNPQEIAKKLMIKLLEEGLNNLSTKIKNKQL